MQNKTPAGCRWRRPREAYYLTCKNKHATVVRDGTLGSVSFACGRRPAYYQGKKLPMCIGCLSTSISKAGAGKEETTAAADVERLKALSIDTADIDLVGKSWVDRLDGTSFRLESVVWTFLDSHDSKCASELIGSYIDENNSDEKHWSAMREIRTSINESQVMGPISDMERRALRRNSPLTSAFAAETDVDENSGEAIKDDEQLCSLMSTAVVYSFSMKFFNRR